jgi:hypothetical protein
MFLIVCLFSLFGSSCIVVQVGGARLLLTARDRQRPLPDPTDAEEFLVVFVFAAVVANPALEQPADEQ